jgi:lipid-binding SYLF domain-containing protein
MKQDADDNARLYGRKVEPKDILIKGVVKPPAAARPLDAVLMKYAPRGGAPFPAV